MDLTTILLTGLVIFSANIIEALTGFGSGIIALPFLAMLIGIKTAVPVIMTISILFTTFMVITNYRKVDLKAYLTIIFFVALGLPIGAFVFSSFNEETLKLILGIFIILSAARSLFLMTHPKKETHSKAYGVFQRIMLFGGGIVQGAFATGGPLIVIYSADKLKDKSVFRATMCTVWLTLNMILVTKNFIVGGIMTGDVFKLVAATIPFFGAGIFIGLKLHKKVSIKAFTALINIVLIAAGISTVLWAILN